MSFEYFVRPFESRDIHGRIIIPSAPSGFGEQATLTWGGKATVNSIGTKGVSVTTHWPDTDDTNCCVEESVQASNQMETVSVSNEGASGGSVTFQRARALKLDKTHQNRCGEAPAEWNSQFNASPASVLKNYETLAAQMGVRTPTVEKCKVDATFNNV